jgi:hypothetical protein
VVDLWSTGTSKGRSDLRTLRTDRPVGNNLWATRAFRGLYEEFVPVDRGVSVDSGAAVDLNKALQRLMSSDPGPTVELGNDNAKGRPVGKNQHVVKRQDAWAVRGEGNTRDTSLHRTQGQAVNAARDLARQQRSEVVIHRPNGRIRDKDSYGNDPTPPVDRRH